jgi:nitrate reductase gamma subunit
MTTIEMLTWVRGPGLVIAIGIFLAGTLVRLIEMLMLGRRKDLSEPRNAASAKYGWRLVFTRFLPPFAASDVPAIAFLASYVFHIGLFLIVFFYVPHITVFKELIGFGWPSLPAWFIDAVTLATMIAMFVVLWHRISDKVKNYLSGFNDYYSWFITIFPIVTGYFAFHRLVLPYNDMLVIHILSVELLLISLPFTKLMHAFSFIFSRWYTGEAAGRKGIKL